MPINHDVQMTQQEPVIVKDGSQLESITLAWQEFGTEDVGDATLHDVTYTLLENGDIERSHWIDGVGPSDIVVAQFINSDPTLTNCEFDGSVLTLTVTATVGTWPQVESETRVYEIVPRPA